MTNHLAIFTDPYIELLFDGSKTIESRFSKIKAAPYQNIDVGDTVYMKQSSGPVRGYFHVKDVEFHELDPIAVLNLSHRYHHQIFPNFPTDFTPYIDRWVECKYATFIHVTHVCLFEESIKIDKKDRRAWVVDYDFSELKNR